MAVKKRFKRIYNAIESIFYTKYEDTPESKVVFIYGFKRNKTDKIDNYIFTACDSDHLYENYKLIYLWSDKFFNKRSE